MSRRKPKLRWDKSQYVIIEEHNEIWLRGSLSRAWAKKSLEKEYGYTICLASQECIDKLKADPSYRDSTWWAQQEENNDREP